ncbi:MAG TPA: hypothetical protein VIP09_11705 [Dehalococcoidia bacterium]
MPTNGIDRGGNKWIETDDPAVVDLLAQYPPNPGGDGRYAIAWGATVFEVDDTTYREALTLSGRNDLEAGNPAGHRAAQERWDAEGDPRNAPTGPYARNFIARPARGKA